MKKQFSYRRQLLSRNCQAALLCVVTVLCCFSSTLELAAQVGVPTVLSSTDFILTKEQSAAGIDGRLKISLGVDEKGQVKEAEIIAGPIWPCGKTPKAELNSFKSAALRTARSFRFAPALDYDRKPVGSTIVLTVTVGEAYRRAVALREAEADPSKIRAGGYVNADVVNGRAIKLAKPNWPMGGGRKRAEVAVDVIVGKDGKVAAAGTLTGPEEFRKASREAACDALFTPTLVDGEPVVVTGRIVYNFVPY